MSDIPSDYMTVKKSHLNYLLALVRYFRLSSPGSLYVPINCIILTITDIIRISSVTSNILSRAEVRTARSHLKRLDLKPTVYNRNPFGRKQGISGYLLGRTVKVLREMVQESSLSQKISSLATLVNYTL